MLLSFCLTFRQFFTYKSVAYEKSVYAEPGLYLNFGILMPYCFMIQKHDLKQKMLLRPQFPLSNQKRNFKLVSYV